MQNTLELRHSVYGFVKEGVEEVQSRDDIETITTENVQAIVYDHSSGLKLVHWIGEIDLRNTTMEKAVRRLKNLAKKEGVENVRVQPKFCYGGRICR